jgi:hypothetical protein
LLCASRGVALNNAKRQRKGNFFMGLQKDADSR